MNTTPTAPQRSIAPTHHHEVPPTDPTESPAPVATAGLHGRIIRVTQYTPWLAYKRQSVEALTA